MPSVVDYPVVLERLTELGYRSLYHNSGAFGFAAGVPTISRGWIGPPDGSIREAARDLVRQAQPPFAKNLSRLMLEMWKTTLPGPAWVMPRSHWAFELEFGHRDWLPAAIEQIGLDPVPLGKLNNAAAIEFSVTESKTLGAFITELLTRLISSDFQLVFLDHSTVCTIHTRCQLWWTTAGRTVADKLDLALPSDADSR